MSIGTHVGAYEIKSPPMELVVYTYSSFMAPGALGSALFPLFEKKMNCRIRARGAGDGGQILTLLDLDQRRGKKGAHVVVGLDQNLWERARPWLADWGEWRPEGYAQVDKDVQLGPGFLPFDSAALSFIVDRQLLQELKLPVPRSLWDLVQPQWRRRVILEDPRTSTPGLVFLLFTQKVLQERAVEFWRAFRNQWLTLTPSWDGAYHLFMHREAPLVWSYMTSQAYHESHGVEGGTQRRYQALTLAEGNPLQVEGAALVKGAEQNALAKKFLEFLISFEVQAMVPEKAWMMPVRKGTPLPASFHHLPEGVKTQIFPLQSEEVERALSQWRGVIQN